MTLLSQFLVDEQFRGLIERYGNELVTRMAKEGPPLGNGNGREKKGKHASRVEPRAGEPDNIDLTSLQERVSTVEARQDAQEALFELLRTKIFTSCSCPRMLSRMRSGCTRMSDVFGAEQGGALPT